MSKATFTQDIQEAERFLSEAITEHFNGQRVQDVITVGLDIKTEAAKEYIKLALANARLMDRKQQDYGSRNISKFGFHGVVVRMSDKIERLCNLIKKNTRPKNESIEDTLRDIHVFANIGLMCRLGRWPDHD